MSATVTVWDVQAQEMREVSQQEAAAGVLRYARSLGPGTPACAVWAAELASGEAQR